MDEFYQVVKELPAYLSLQFSEISPDAACKIHELRFKEGAQAMATFAGKQVNIATLLPRKRGGIFLQEGGESVLPFSQKQIEEIFFHLCGGSVHSYEEELKQGFFTIPGGHRVGVGGKYIPATRVYSTQNNAGQTVWQLQQVTSLNLRIARHKTIELPTALEGLLSERFVGVVILGEPDSGKTTMLRNMITFLLQKRRTVVVIDERGEIAMQGVDMISGMEKSSAVQVALKTLSPEVIVLDEVGTLSELSALEQGFFGGVDLIITLHASSFAEAEQKPQFQYLQSHNMIRAACLLQGRNHPGQLQDIKQYQEVNRYQNTSQYDARQSKHARIVTMAGDTTCSQ